MQKGEIMWYYQIFGLTVASDYELGEAYPIAPTDNVDVTIAWEDMADEYKNPTETEKNKGTGCISHIEKDWACIRYIHNGTFMISKGNKISYYLVEGYDKTYVNQIMLCACMTIVVFQRNRLIIHGSGIFYKGKALIISGDSGAGKSSLSTEIMGRNYLQMADDQVVIDIEDNKAMAYPAFPVRKLCADTVEKLNIPKERLIPMPDLDREKYGVILKNEFYNQKAELGGMVILQIGDVQMPELKEITGSEKLKYITRNFFRGDMYQENGFPPELFMKTVMVANQMPVFVLTRPEGKMTVKEQAELVEQTL